MYMTSKFSLSDVDNLIGSTALWQGPTTTRVRIISSNKQVEGQMTADWQGHTTTKWRILSSNKQVKPKENVTLINATL